MRLSSSLSLIAAAAAAVLAAGPSPAAAEQIGALQISATNTGGLPAVSKDGTGFARLVRVQPAGCGGTQLFVDLGQTGGPSKDPASKLHMIKDECSKVSSAVTDANLAKVNETLRTGAFQSVKATGPQQLPASLTLGGQKVSVNKASGANQVTIALEGSAANRWTVTLDGPALEVRNAYEARAGGKRYIAVLVAAKAKDTGDAGRERWLDFWPVEGSGTTTAVGSDTPAGVAIRWITALKNRDVGEIEALVSPPFWKVGLNPTTGARAKSCKKKQKATKDRQVAAIAACIADGASSLYGKGGADSVAEIDMNEFPEELKKHKKKVAKMVRSGHKLARFSLNDEGLYVHLVLVLDPETNFQTVSAAIEFVEVETSN